VHNGDKSKKVLKLIFRNTFCGTYEYMSPEVVNKVNYVENVDIWSLGILLYEIVNGSTPFVAETSTEIMNKITN
jgi:serine/threonine protein kinase